MGLRERLLGLNSVNKSDYMQAQLNEYSQVIKGLNGKEKFNYDPPLITGAIPMGNEYRDVPSVKGITDLRSVLRRMSTNIIVQSIIRTRANQVALYCTPARLNEDGIGFKIVLRDPDGVPNQYDRSQMAKLEDFILHTGINHDFQEDDFSDFINKIIFDLYVYDQINFELVYNRSNVLTEFNAVDAQTMFIGSEKKRVYKQVIDNHVMATFTPKEMAWECMNPRTDIRVSGYGFSPIEIAMSHLVYQENTEEFNQRFFSQGGTTKGLLLIKAMNNQSRQAFSNFRRFWTNSFSGVNGSWKIPVVNADDAKFVSMSQSARDMEFSNWLTYTVNAICAAFTIDPSEIGFPNNGGVNNKSARSVINEGNTAETRLRSSRDKGLDPLIKFLEVIINKYIVEQFANGRYMFRFVGGDSQSKLNKIAVAKLMAESGAVWNECRKEMGLPELTDDPTANTIGAAVYVQARGQTISQQQFAQLNHGQANGASTLQQQGKQVTNGNQLQRGQGNANPVGTDGSIKGQAINPNATNQGGKDSLNERNKS